MLNKNKRFIYSFLILLLSSLFANELFFNDKLGLSFSSNFISDTELIFVDNEIKRKTISLASASIALLIKGNHRIDISYYIKPNPISYNGFNYPYSSHYYGIGSNHFIKNKTSLNLNFNAEFKYIKEKSGLYDNFLLGFGISKENDSKDIASYTHLTFFFQKPSIGENSLILKFDYPMHIQVLPTDNIPSKQSFLFTPSAILDNKDVYFSLSLSLQHIF